jgi:hypothetical protein
MEPLPESLVDSIRSKVVGEKPTSEKIEPVKKSGSSGVNVLFNIIAKNTMSFPDIARDLNVARQNAQQLVKIMGGDSKTKAETLTFKSESEQRKKTEVQVGEEKTRIQEKQKVSQESKEERQSALGFFQKEDQKEQEMESGKISKVQKDIKKSDEELKKAESFFSMSNIMGLAVAAFQLGSLLYVFWEPIKEAFVTIASALWDSIKEKFSEFVGKLEEWFNEIVQPIIDKVKEFIMPIVDAISGFLKSIGDWFVDKFGFIGEWFTNAFSFVGKIVDKFKVMIEGVKETLRNAYENSGVLKRFVPDFIVKFIGAKTEKEKEEEKRKEELQKKSLSNVVDDSREAKKLQRQQTQAQEAEKERAEIPRKQEERQQRVAEKEKVAALEKEKQYTGTDEIVRARLGLPSVAASEMEVGPEVTEPITPLSPTIVVAVSPVIPVAVGPTPTATGTKKGEEKPPSPISAEPPTATAKQAEGPAGGGSLASVASVQPGVDLSGINPEFEKRLVNMATAFKEQTGKKVLITSAYRSNEKQAELFNAKLAQVGGDRAKARKMVAEPMPPLGQGRGSFHLKGLAIDINSKGAGGINALAGSRDSPTGWLEKFGLTRPVKNEDWHIQPSGTVPTADNPVNPGAPTLVAGKDGKPMNLAEGKKESMPQASAMQTAASGGDVSAASKEIAVSHREQVKPSTPTVVNTPVINNTTIVNNEISGRSKPCNSAQTLTGRLT